MTDIHETLSEREKTYGNFRTCAEVSQAIKLAFHFGKNWESLSDEKKEALEMVSVKIARILNGDPQHVDSWRDCIGYFQLVLDASSNSK